MNFLYRYFKISENGSNIRREIIGGITTFMTCAYILFVQPAVLSQAGMDFGSVMMATAIAAGITTILMGVMANYPIALAPAMGHNFFFVYTVCLGMGISWQIALGANFISGVLFIILALLPFGKELVNVVPNSLKNAIAVGIGLLIAFVGLQWSGIVVSHPGSIVGLGDLRQPYVILSITGFLITSFLFALRVRGALLIGILATAIIGIPMKIVSYPSTFLSKPPSILPTLFKLDIGGAFLQGVLMIIFVFFFLDVFDTIGTLIAVSQQAGLLKDGKLPRVRKALLSDAIGTVGGTLLGTSTVTSYIESAAGVSAGARTGFSSLITGICFLLSIFIYPIAKIIGGGIKINGALLHPVTAPALILIGSLMLKNVKYIEWDDVTESIPAFLTLIIIPLTFSITEGIAFGFILYSILKIFTGRIKEGHWLIYLFSLLFILRYLMIFK
jgi:AGZA family xanthine/uracil permease-like MFS transporter